MVTVMSSSVKFTPAFRFTSADNSIFASTRDGFSSSESTAISSISASCMRKSIVSAAAVSGASVSMGSEAAVSGASVSVASEAAVSGASVSMASEAAVSGASVSGASEAAVSGASVAAISVTSVSVSTFSTSIVSGSAASSSAELSSVSSIKELLPSLSASVELSSAAMLKKLPCGTLVTHRNAAMTHASLLFIFLSSCLSLFCRKSNQNPTSGTKFFRSFPALHGFNIAYSFFFLVQLTHFALFLHNFVIFVHENLHLAVSTDGGKTLFIHLLSFLFSPDTGKIQDSE